MLGRLRQNEIPVDRRRKRSLSFGDLRVRFKLVVLHNCFFFVLAAGVYFALIPLFEEHVAQAQAREIGLLRATFRQPDPELRQPGRELYEYREGRAEDLNIPLALRPELRAHPGEILQDEAHPEVLYLYDARSGRFRRMNLPLEFYASLVNRARVILFAVLGTIYVAAILVLEGFIMPRYVYRPLRVMLDADEATRAGQREAELIAEEQISDDEIGQIMRSRNATVSQLRRQEEELQTALRRLEELNEDLRKKNYLLETAKKSIADQDRLASLGLLSASVAHEINTPLAVLHGSIEKLRETVPDRNSQQRLERMLRVTERLRRMSAALLDFARPRRQATEAVNLQAVVEEAWSLLAIDERAAQVRFQNEVRAQHEALGNPDRLVQLLVNLLRNALNAAAPSGHIVVRSEMYWGEDGGRVYLAVEDDGPGIPADVLPNIFEAFVTTRLDARGTGLGLTVAEGIVNQHGGSISASNRPEGGARLEVWLPAPGGTRAVSAATGTVGEL
jgi:signal transduction histidine kinase